jgi:hypothetical protein
MFLSPTRGGEMEGRQRCATGGGARDEDGARRRRGGGTSNRVRVLRFVAAAARNSDELLRPGYRAGRLERRL